MQACHGRADFKANVETALDFLNQQKDRVYVRWCLEDEGWNSSDWKWFEEKTNYVIDKYPNIIFVGGFATKGDSSPALLRNMESDIDQYVWERETMIDIPTIKKFAEDNNPKNKAKINRVTWSMFDYINIGLGLTEY